MNVTGTLNVLVNERKDKSNKIWKSFFTDLSSKKENGEYDNAPIKVVFGGKTKEWSKTLDVRFLYKLDVTSGFLTFQRYVTKENVEKVDYIIMVLECGVKEKKMLPSYAEEEKKKKNLEQAISASQAVKISEDDFQVTFKDLPF